MGRQFRHAIRSTPEPPPEEATARGKTTDAAPVAVRHRSGCRPLPGGMRPCLARWLLFCVWRVLTGRPAIATGGVELL